MFAPSISFDLSVAPFVFNLNTILPLWVYSQSQFVENVSSDFPNTVKGPYCLLLIHCFLSFCHLLKTYMKFDCVIID